MVGIKKTNAIITKIKTIVSFLLKTFKNLLMKGDKQYNSIYAVINQYFLNVSGRNDLKSSSDINSFFNITEVKMKSDKE